MYFLPTIPVHLPYSDHPVRLQTPGINLVLDYSDNFKLFSVVHCEQLRKLPSVLILDIPPRVPEKADNLEPKIPW